MCWQGELTVSLNATQALEDAGHPIDIARRIGNIWITSQTLRSSFDVPLSSSTNLSLVHRMVLGQRRAGATYLATLRHQYSENLLLSLTPSLLSTSPVVISRAKYNLNQDSFAELSATTRSFVAPPTLNITGGTTVAQGWTSFVGFRSGQYSLGQWGAQSPASMATMPTFTISLNGGKGWVFTSETSLQQTTLSIQWAQRVFGSCRIRLATALSSLGGFSINCEGEALLPYDTISSANVALGTAGVSLKLKLSRLGQSIALPIQLSHETDTLLALSFVVIPTASFVTAQYLFFKPRKRRRIQARLAELRAEYSQDLIERQLEAKTAAALLRDQVLKRVETERRKSGLVILSASYGPEPSQETSDVNFVDVAVPLQALVTNSQLIIPGGRSKSGLLGFVRPMFALAFTIGHSKSLAV